MDNDFSEYEIRRLENIRRNEKILRDLGLSGNQIPIKKKKKKKPSKKRKNARRSTPKIVGRRKSRRLQGQEAEIRARDNVLDPESEVLAEKRDDDDDDERIRYEEMPRQPDRLDDYEFQIYVRLKAWRLVRKRELNIEPFKVFQNRTLCEIVRRRRNDPSWAAASLDDEEKIAEDLLEVWGIGNAKVYGCEHSRIGFANEVRSVLNGDKKFKELLQKSRDEEKKVDDGDDDRSTGTY